MSPRTRTALAVACALALTFTGVVMAATPKLSSIHRLTAAQLSAIERVYVAALPLDKPNATQAQIDAATRKTLSACLKLSKKDPLLRAIRAGCPAVSALTSLTADIGACSDAACLKGAIGKARTELKNAVDGSHVSDRAVKATHLSAGCKRALVTPPAGYAAYKQLDAALGKLQHALSTGSASDLADAEAALNAADKQSKGLPTTRSSLKLLRSDCR